MKTFNLVFVFIIVLAFNLNAQVKFSVSPEKWNEDIDFLVDNIVNIVPEFNSKVDQLEFNNRVKKLRQDLASKTTEDIVWEIQSLLNLIEDDGCNVMPFQKILQTKLLPIKSYWFDDGLFICDASANHSSLKGEQIIQINGIEINELFNRLATSINADNEHSKRNLFPLYAISPSLLKHKGLGSSNRNIELVFASGKTVMVMAEGLSEYRKLKRELPNDGVFELTNSNHKTDYYWFEYLPNSSTLFVQLQWIYNNKEEVSFSGFVNSIEKEIENGNATKIILDLRYGGGGNGFKFKGLTDLLRDSETINKRGNLFVLTSRETRGAILELTSVLELNTKAVLIGEATAEGPNKVGDTKQITLPNSGLSISLTKVFWPTSWSFDNRKTIKPTLPISYTYSQYQAKQDPWISAVLAYKPANLTNPIPEVLFQSLIGSYKINERKILIEEDNGKLFLSIKRPIKSFFEVRTELFFVDDRTLSTDIRNVFVNYGAATSGKAKMEGFSWKGKDLK